jgi:hypothetical protein
MLGDLADLVGRALQVAAQVLEEALHGVAQPAGEGRVEHRLAGAAGLVAQGVEAHVAEQVVGQVGEHAAHRVVLLQALLELVLLGADLAHHVFDDALVLAAQVGELLELLAQAGRRALRSSRERLTMSVRRRRVLSRTMSRLVGSSSVDSAARG